MPAIGGIYFFQFKNNIWQYITTPQWTHMTTNVYSCLYTAGGSIYPLALYNPFSPASKHFFQISVYLEENKFHAKRQTITLWNEAQWSLEEEATGRKLKDKHCSCINWWLLRNRQKEWRWTQNSVLQLTLVILTLFSEIMKSVNQNSFLHPSQHPKTSSNGESRLCWVYHSCTAVQYIQTLWGNVL